GACAALGSCSRRQGIGPQIAELPRSGLDVLLARRPLSREVSRHTSDLMAAWQGCGARRASSASERSCGNLAGMTRGTFHLIARGGARVYGCEERACTLKRGMKKMTRPASRDACCAVVIALAHEDHQRSYAWGKPKHSK